MNEISSDPLSPSKGGEAAVQQSLPQWNKQGLFRSNGCLYWSWVKAATQQRSHVLASEIISSGSRSLNIHPWSGHQYVIHGSLQSDVSLLWGTLTSAVNNLFLPKSTWTKEQLWNIFKIFAQCLLTEHSHVETETMWSMYLFGGARLLATHWRQKHTHWRGSLHVCELTEVVLRGVRWDVVTQAAPGYLVSVRFREAAWPSAGLGRWRTPSTLELSHTLCTGLALSLVWKGTCCSEGMVDVIGKLTSLHAYMVLMGRIGKRQNGFGWFVWTSRS